MRMVIAEFGINCFEKSEWNCFEKNQSEQNLGWIVLKSQNEIVLNTWNCVCAKCKINMKKLYSRYVSLWRARAYRHE